MKRNQNQRRKNALGYLEKQLAARTAKGNTTPKYVARVQQEIASLKGRIK